MTLLLPPVALLWCVHASRLERVPLEWQAMRGLLKRETGTYNVTFRHATLRNPRSTAYGVAQFLGKGPLGSLTGTWKSVGIRKTNDPIMQIRAMYRYVNRRYGSAAKALAFHKRRRFY